MTPAAEAISRELVTALSEAEQQVEQVRQDLAATPAVPVVVGNNTPTVPAVDEDLIGYLRGEDLTDVPPTVDRAQLDVWVDRRLQVVAHINAQIAHNESVAKARIAMVRDHFDGENAVLQRRADYLLSVLTSVANAYPYPPKNKTRKLPFGTLGKKLKPALLVVGKDKASKEAITAYAEENVPGAIEYEPKLLKDALNDWWTSVGEPELPGCTIEPARDAPYVSVKQVDHE